MNGLTDPPSRHRFVDTSDITAAASTAANGPADSRTWWEKLTPDEQLLLAAGCALLIVAITVALGWCLRRLANISH